MPSEGNRETAAIGEHRFTIGYGPLSAFRRTGLKILDVAEISPNAKNVRAGRYPLAVPFGLVYRAPLPPLSQSFVDFLGSEEARKILNENDCYPVGEEKAPRGSAPP
jgi:phosphate transport system substrate-binding protein